ncbi:TPA: Fur family transcriptional regulator [Legionella feeleii]|uniref:Transcriptional regulator np20, Fur family n=1 Tax=Legionella feeleii TaxID=453 RepID=A0A0W0TMH9_9GAMM|nr:Fur family transcriptional regulator [Legionella feeleii]KTC96731.1 transcriptional regulator np20, Fur family [Legionella feeleii]SPX60597.1 transcriptional regulator np20, Fur family [Legionella feeleii]STX39833.1 transcriptional regulator np20, Fur family [Legionella feeleii]
MSEGFLNEAYEYCIKNGYRFTEPRERVLKILLYEAKPMGAYEILERLSSEMGKQNPPTVYRAIQFWHQEGFIHCIDSLKAYVACSHGKHIGQSKFLICTQCDFVKELDSVVDFTPVTKLATAIDFEIMSCTVEIKGLCANCKVHQVIASHSC